MSKTLRNVYDDALTFDNLLKAYNNAKKNKQKKEEVILFEMNLETNLYNLYRELKACKYKPGKYREFTIYEPKERIIKSLPFRDRIVHQWYVEEFIKPYFIPRFISDTYACIPGRGTHKASYKIREFTSVMYRKYGNFYYVKCDIKKYFYTVDKDVLFKIMSKVIKDKKLLLLTKAIIYDGEELGIAIGNYTSQYFANIYLSELDYYIKYELGVRFYVRYMDDFVCLVRMKSEARDLLNKISVFAQNGLHLKLNHKSRIIPSYRGIDFCGYVTKRNKTYVRKSFIKRCRKRVRKWNTLYKMDKLNMKKMNETIQCFKAHASHSDTIIGNYINRYFKFKL